VAFVAGTYARSSAAKLGQADLAELRKALQIGPTDKAGFACTARLQIAWIDIEGSVGAADRRDDGSLALLWGSCYRDGHDDAANARLLQIESGKDHPALADISGDFGFAFHDLATDTLQLLTDKLGVRALFVFCNADRVWFSSSLRVMERLPSVRKVMDLRAVTEMAFFGWPIGDRTPYRDIRVLRPGERVRVDATRVRSDYYWRWNTLPRWNGSRAECVEDLAGRFRHSIRRRRGGDERVFSLLSGGLDSRMIATALREQGAQVVACNFSPAGTQDQVYSSEAARALDCSYSSLPLVRGRTPNLYAQLSSAWREGIIDSGGVIDRPHWVFAGVGGSTGFGAVFWDEELIGYFRSGRTREGVEFFFKRMGYQLVERLYRREHVARMREMLVEGVLAELREFACEDPARSFHLFEMMNDQRRHLHGHWDNAASHGMQFHVPYFDSQFLERMLSIPLDWTLYHDLYYEWMERFDPAARSVPWQVYPGHKPCPIPATREFPTQWAASGKYVLSDRSAWNAPLAEVLATRPFPVFLNRNYLRYVRLRRAIGGDYGYAVDAARAFRDIWVRSEGRFDWG
jgi:asparagine synthetase B (glutamine-hydrolysing)